MGAAWVDGYELEHGDEEDGGKGGGVRSQADKTGDKTDGKYFPEMVFLSGIGPLTFSAAPIIFKETKKHVPLLHRIRRETHTNEIKLMKAILLEGIASGEFKSITKDECDNIAITGVTIIHGMHLSLFLDGKVPSVEDKMAVMMDIFLRGLK